jgi:hypothetical protein
MSIAENEVAKAASAINAQDYSIESLKELPRVDQL